MNKILLLALSATVVFTACKKNDDDNSSASKARVMFVNAAMDVGDSLRAQVNNQTVRTVPFLGNSGYVPLDPGTGTKVSYVFSGSGNLYQESTTNFSANSSYSVFAGGDANLRAMIIRTDDLTPPAAGKARVRLVHLATAPGGLFVNASIGDTVTFASSTPFGNATEFREVNSGIVAITMGDPSKLSSIRSLPAQNLAPGKIYTFLYAGSLNATGTYQLRITSILHN